MKTIKEVIASKGYSEDLGKLSLTELLVKLHDLEVIRERLNPSVEMKIEQREDEHYYFVLTPRRIS